MSGSHDVKTILAGTDFTELGDLAVSTAVDMARELNAERIHIVHAMSPAPVWAFGPAELPSVTWEAAFKAMQDHAQRTLDGVHIAETPARVTRQVRLGSPARELAAAATEIGAELAVVASHKRGRVGRFVLGSVAAALIRASPCPVAVVGADRRWRRPLRSLVAAIDGSAISTAVLEQAMKLAKEQRARLHVVSVLDLVPFAPPLGDLLDRAEAELRREIAARVARARVAAPEVEVEVTVEVGTSATPAVLALIERSASDLLVIGTSGHNAWERMLLGSTAARLIAEAPCPVLVVPAAHA